ASCTKGPAQAPIPLCVKRENYFFFAAFFFATFFAAFFFLAAIVLSPGKEGFIPADPPVDRWVIRKHQGFRILVGPNRGLKDLSRSCRFERSRLLFRPLPTSS
ncbi:MAG: hypothetical protein ACYC0B_11365, partial [Gemmatimonadaceae bacterium]